MILMTACWMKDFEHCFFHAQSLRVAVAETFTHFLHTSEV